MLVWVTQQNHIQIMNKQKKPHKLKKPLKYFLYFWYSITLTQPTTSHTHIWSYQRAWLRQRTNKNVQQQLELKIALVCESKCHLHDDDVIEKKKNKIMIIIIIIIMIIIIMMMMMMMMMIIILIIMTIIIMIIIIIIIIIII